MLTISESIVPTERFILANYLVAIAIAGAVFVTPSVGGIDVAESEPPASDEMADVSDDLAGEGEERDTALLVASLAEYGYQNRDALALLSAANILKGMDAGVAKRDGSHDADENDHGTSGLFLVEDLVADARRMAEMLSTEREGDIIRFADSLSEGVAGSKGYLGMLHTHYIWWCGPPQFIPGFCGYTWVSHY